LQVNLGWKLAFASGNGQHTVLLGSYDRSGARRPASARVYAPVFFADTLTNNPLPVFLRVVDAGRAHQERRPGVRTRLRRAMVIIGVVIALFALHRTRRVGAVSYGRRGRRAARGSRQPRGASASAPRRVGSDRPGPVPGNWPDVRVVF